MVVPSVVFCVTLPLLSYVKVVVLRPFAICVTAWGLAYAVPPYGYRRGALGAATRIFVKCIRTGLALHVANGDSAIPVSNHILTLLQTECFTFPIGLNKLAVKIAMPTGLGDVRPINRSAIGDSGNRIVGIF